MAPQHSELQLRKELAEICRRTYQAGLVAATDGNASARLSHGRVLISPSGYCLGELTPEDFILVNSEGQPRGSKEQPTQELAMHLAIYEARPDVHAVLHAHPPITIGFSIAGESLAGCMIPEVVVGLGTIPTVAYTTPTTRDTAEAVRHMIRRRDALILERHGTVTVGETPTDAFRKLEKVEHTAKITFIAKQLGHSPSLPAEEVHRLLRMREEQGLPPVIPNSGEG